MSCHSERSEESRQLPDYQTTEILRFAQNDRKMPLNASSAFVAVIERGNHRPGVAPIGFNFNVEFKEDFGREQPFQFAARLAANLLQHLAPRADNDRLLRLPFNHDAGVDARDLLAFLKALDDDGRRVGKFLPSVEDDLLSNDF
jgi:hypothetical protein